MPFLVVNSVNVICFPSSIKSDKVCIRFPDQCSKEFPFSGYVNARKGMGIVDSQWYLQLL